MKSLVALATLAFAAILASCSSGSPAPTGSPTGAASPTGGASPSAAAVACLPEPVADADATVSIADFSFGPASVTIAAGDVVTWTNTGGTPHTATLDQGPACADERMSPDAQHSVQFNVAGTYAYHCSIHPSMTASVTVEP